MRVQKLVCVVSVLILFAVGVCAQDQPQKVVKHVPAAATSPTSGRDMYKAYCAACHGENGKGMGPAAEALKVPPSDLTALSKNNGGKYPSMKVTTAIRGEGNFPAHGSKEMPVWGQLFWSMSHGHEGEVQQRIANLDKYIESLQTK